MKFCLIKIATNFVSCKGVCWQRVEGGAWLVGPDGGGLDTAFLYPGTDGGGLATAFLYPGTDGAARD